MSQKIIFIHGLASKPKIDVLYDNWSKCLYDNLHLYNNNSSINTDEQCSMVYWANEIPNHLEDTQDYANKVKLQIDELISKRVSMGNDFHVGLGDKFKNFFLDKGLDAISFLSSALTIKDNLSEALLKEIRLYKNDQYIADKIRKTLEEELIRAWENNEKVCILSHSMGTIIAYDVLWRFSNKNVAPFKSFSDKKVNLFITMGSPLGDKVVQNLLFAEDFKDNDRRKYFDNVQTWINFSALGDAVSHDSTLKDDFIKPMQDLGLLDENSTDYVDLYNPFKTPDGNSNAHKSYGYLLQPKLAKVVNDFLEN